MIPSFHHRALARLSSRFCFFHRVSPFEILADFANGNTSESIDSSCSKASSCFKSLDDSHGLNEIIDTSTMRLGMFVPTGGCDSSNPSVRNNDDCRDHLIDIPNLGTEVNSYDNGGLKISTHNERETVLECSQSKKDKYDPDRHSIFRVHIRVLIRAGSL